MATTEVVSLKTSSINQPRRILLAGNPNSGKTTLFNTLTGSRYKVANYPGVTVEKREGVLTLPALINTSVTLVDLPGMYSLFGTSLDEAIATKAVLGLLNKNAQAETAADLVIAVVDSANLERNLYLVSQLIDGGFPLILALNMADLAEKKGLRIHNQLLERLIGCPVVSLSAHKGIGIDALKEEISRYLLAPPRSAARFSWLSSNPSARKTARQLGQLQLVESARSSELSELVGCALLSDALAPSTPAIKEQLEAARQELSKSGVDPLTFEATERYQWINQLVKQSSSVEPTNSQRWGEKVDYLVTHRIWGTVTLLVIMATIFQSIFLWAQPPMEIIDSLFAQLGVAVEEALPVGPLRSLLVDGIITGVGSVLIFIPQIALLFFFLGLLEDSGYLSRAAFLMDRLMRHVGLQGRSFIPLLSSFACAIPGIMSTRTIPSWSDRVATIMIAPLMSCSARLPVYTVLIAACIPDTRVLGVFSLQGLVLLSMYLAGILGAAIVALILKLTLLRREPALFVMEMPQFRIPSFRMVGRDMLDRIIIFIKNAGTIILACTVILWFLASYPRTSDTLPGEHVKKSYAGQIGSLIEPAIKPLGFNWEIGVGILASFAAREVFVSSLATVYNIENINDSPSSLISTLRRKNNEGSFTTLTAVSLMIFYVFACQCISTVAVCRRETGSWKWTAFMVSYMTLLAYGASFIVYQGGQLILGSHG